MAGQNNFFKAIKFLSLITSQLNPLSSSSFTQKTSIVSTHSFVLPKKTLPASK